ncbi:MAG: MlaD family protein [Planctomycetota bacterium]
MRKTLRRSATLGGFILVVMLGLTVATLKLKDITLFGAPQYWNVVFGEQSEVREGARVFTSGVKIGTVKKVSLLPPDKMAKGAFVHAVIAIREDVQLWEKARVELARTTLLGSYGVHLDRGDPKLGPLEKGTILIGVIRADVMAKLGKLVEDNEAGIRSAVGDLEAFAAKLRGAADKHDSGVVGHLLLEDEAYDALTNVLTYLDKQKASKDSVLGMLLREDESLVKDIRNFMSLAGQLRTDYNDKNGVLYKLFTDSELSDKFGRVMDSLVNVSEDLEHPEAGTLFDVLLHDKSQGKKIDDTLSDLRRAVAKLDDSDTPIGLLFNDAETARGVKRVIAALSDPQGGTLGRLINDDTIVRDLESMLMEFREAGRISRENAPLGSLISFTALFFTILN